MGKTLGLGSEETILSGSGVLASGMNAMRTKVMALSVSLVTVI